MVCLGFKCMLTRIRILDFNYYMTRIQWMGFHVLVDSYLLCGFQNANDYRNVSVVSLSKLYVARLPFTHSTPITIAVASIRGITL